MTSSRVTVRHAAITGGPAVSRGLRSRRSAHRLLDELRDPGLVCLGQLLHREGDGPHGAVVELRAVVEAEHRVPLLELRGVAEEADDLAVLVRVSGHSVPGLRREVRGALFNERV